MIREVRLVEQSELPQQIIDFGGIGVGNAIKFFEKMIVRKDRRYELPISLACAVIDAHPVESDLPGIRLIETAEQLHESRFARPVAAGDENEFARLQRKVYGAHLKHSVRPFI